MTLPPRGTGGTSDSPLKGGGLYGDGMTSPSGTNDPMRRTRKDR